MTASRLAALVAAVGIAAATTTSTVVAKASPTTQPTERLTAIEKVYELNGVEVRLINRSPEMPDAMTRALVDTFYKVYPTLRETFNPNATAKVTIFIDPEYTGIAEAGGGRIRVSPKWIGRKPDDNDLITHEAMHLIQAYPGGAGPGWITEGIADYARHVYGVNNAAGGWSLPEFKPSQKVTDSYRVTARFFVWLEAKVKPGIIKSLDSAMREKRYAETFWQEQTSQTLAELWARYAQDPALPEPTKSDKTTGPYSRSLSALKPQKTCSTSPNCLVF